MYTAETAWDADVAGRLDLTSYLLRCTGDVVILSTSDRIAAQDIALALVRALAGGNDATTTVIDATSANQPRHLADRLMLQPDQEPGGGHAAAQLAERLRTRNTGLAVLVEDAHGLPVHLIRDLVALNRRVSARLASMPLALICPPAEADRLEAIAQDSGCDAECLHRVAMQPPDDPRPMPALDRSRRHLHPIWIAIPLALLVAALLSIDVMNQPNSAETGAPPPTTAQTESGGRTVAGTPIGAGASSGRSTVPTSDVTDDEAATGAVASVTQSSQKGPIPDTALPVDIALASPDIPTLSRVLSGTPTRGNAAPETTPPASTDEHSNAQAAPPTAATAPTATTKATGKATASPAKATVDALPETHSVSADSAARVNRESPTVSVTKEPAESTSPNTSSAKTAKSASLKPDWLANRPGDHYTLQLIAGRKAATAKRYLATHPQIHEQARTVTVDGSDGRWHLVLVGDFPNRTTAIANVPTGIGADQIYARTFRSIRK